MDRRGFLKRVSALSVAGAFPPLPDELAPLPFEEVTGIDRSTKSWWQPRAEADGLVVVNEEVYAAFERVWRECTRDLRL